MIFLLHKDKGENGKQTTQKHECGSPFIQAFLCINIHAFPHSLSKQYNYHGEGTHLRRSQNQINI